MTLRIAVVLRDFSFGGTERIAIRLANRWSANRANVSVFAGREEGLLRSLLEDSVSLWLATPRIGLGLGSAARLGQAVRRRLIDEPVDVLFVPGNCHWPVAAAFRGIPKAQRPIIVAQVSNALRKPQRGRLRQHLFEARMRQRLKACDAVVTMAETDRILANQILRRTDCIAIASPAVGASTEPPLPIDPNSRLILAAGRLVKQKAFEVLIEAFAIVSRHDSEAQLLILGDGPERSILERQILALGLSERVQMPGYVEDIRPFLDRARMFVLSSRFEGYPAVIIEALSAGRPVVSTACTPAADELLSAPGAGRVVPLEHPKVLAHAILAELKAPPPIPSTLAKLIEPYRIDGVAANYEGLFRHLLMPRMQALGG